MAKKRKISHFLLLHIGVPLLYLFFRLIGWTLRFSDEGDWPNLLKRSREGRRWIAACYHGDSFIAGHMLRRYRQIIPGNILLMASRSRDGELMARFLKMAGAKVYRGSSSRGGSRALLEIKNALEPEDCAGLAVDGPRGPRHEVKEGVLLLSRKTSRPVIPVVTYASKKWTFRSWDRMELPKPFSRARILYGEPVTVPEEADKAEIEALRQKLEDTMKAMKAEVEG